MVKFKFRSKLILAFSILILVSVVPVLVLVNTQIETISKQKIKKDLKITKTVFERYQLSQLASYSERTANFILTQPNIRAEIATISEDTESQFGNIFSNPGTEEKDPGNPTPSDVQATLPTDSNGASRPNKRRKNNGINELPVRQNRILSILQEVSLFKESQVFFIVDFGGNLIFNKVNPGVFDISLSLLPDIYTALQGNELFTWWNTREETLKKLGLLPENKGKNSLFQMFLKPVIFSGEVKGLICIGFKITEDDLKKIIGITQSEIAFVSNGFLYLNSLTSVPEDTLVRLGKAAGNSKNLEVIEFRVEGEDFLTLPVAVKNSIGKNVGEVIVYRSKTKEQQVFNELKKILNIIGLIALAVAGSLAYLIIHNVTGVVRQLFHGVQQIRQGNLDYHLEIKSKDEFGELGKAFNEMTAGLKEKEAIRDTFKRYVSSSVVDEILRDVDDIKLGGENKNLTVQFSDIAGFTKLSENMAPEDVVKFLNEYLKEMTFEVEAESGIVDKYIGDAVMAFWGTPVVLENHAIHACRAALGQIKKTEELRERWREKENLKHFSIRLGLHSGDVVVGNIGSSTRMDYTIIGDCVNTASRLEGMNKVYGTNILISEATYQMVKEEIIARELDLIVPVGKSEPIRIYELVCLKDEGSQELLEKHDHFMEALAHYRNQQFMKALGGFRKLEKTYQDPAAKTFIARSQNFIKSPPMKDWDGVFKSTSK